MSTTTNTTPTPRIAIIGAGPGGLTCARILQRHGITVTVHDRETGPDVRNQGGTLDLHEDNGQIALREAGLLEEFFRLSRAEGQESRQMDAAGTLLFHHVPEEGESFKPEIDRGQLRDLLLDSLQPGTVHWGHTLRSVDGPAEGPRQLHFTDGTTIEADLVIGADGAWSKVRAAISPATPATAASASSKPGSTTSRSGTPTSPNSSARAAPPRPTATAVCSPSAAVATTSASTPFSASPSTGSPPRA